MACRHQDGIPSLATVRAIDPKKLSFVTDQTTSGTRPNVSAKINAPSPSPHFPPSAADFLQPPTNAPRKHVQIKIVVKTNILTQKTALASVHSLITFSSDGIRMMLGIFRGERIKDPKPKRH